MKPVKAPQRDDPWLQKAMVAVEQAITDTVNEFIAHPYLYRVEHSLHTRLYALLIQQPILAERVRIGRTTWMTQLVHKEWPETRPRLDAKGKGRRGLFDIAVLSPGQLERSELINFRQGRIEAPIVIEVGLDYGFEHLRLDHYKLKRNKVTAPYLVHLSRISVTDEVQTQNLLCDGPSAFRTAYVHHKTDGSYSMKQVADEGVATSTRVR